MSLLTFYNKFYSQCNLKDNSYYFGLYLIEIFILSEKSIVYNNKLIALSVINLIVKIFKHKINDKIILELDSNKLIISEIGKNIYLIYKKLPKDATNSLKKKYSKEKYNNISQLKIENINN